jgi:oligoribonuclease
MSVLVWLDLETTGLNTEKDEILEVALCATNEHLIPVSGLDPLNIVVNPKHGLDLNNWPLAVVKMHTANGLIDSLAEGEGYDPNDAEEIIHNWLFALCNTLSIGYTKMGGAGVVKLDDKDDAFLMAGSTVGQFDRPFFFRYFPKAKLFFHYRVIDVSSVKELVRNWYGKDHLYLGPSVKAHRALDDLYVSIDELRHYRDHYFVKEPNFGGFK